MDIFEKILSWCKSDEELDFKKLFSKNKKVKIKKQTSEIGLSPNVSQKQILEDECLMSLGCAKAFFRTHKKNYICCVPSTKLGIVFIWENYNNDFRCYTDNFAYSSILQCGYKTEEDMREEQFFKNIWSE